MKVLVSWVGVADLRACKRDDRVDDCGPIYRLLRDKPFDRIELLTDIDSPRDDWAHPDVYVEWLASGNAALQNATANLHWADANLRNDYRDTYAFTDSTVQAILDTTAGDDEISFLLSPGNAACQVAMLLFARFSARSIALYNSSVQREVEEVRLPFALSGKPGPEIQLAGQNPVLESVTEEDEAFKKIRAAVSGRSDSVVQQIKLAAGAAKVDIPVLVLGDTGTGKEVFARAIHAASPRADKPFLAVHLASVSDALVESELFGHEKGAFTGASEPREGKIELAKEGTLFLDEIGELKEEIQIKLLRVLEGHPFTKVGGTKECTPEFRLIAATHRNLKQMVEQGKFRSDLYQRLGFMKIVLPTLGERRDDVLVLAEEFLAETNRKTGKSLSFSEDATRMLAQYNWPGNVRELRHLVEQLGSLCQGPGIRSGHVLWALEMAGWPKKRQSPVSTMLDRLSPREFIRHWAEVTDELIQRANEEGQLPAIRGIKDEFPERKDEMIGDADSIEKRYVLPMLYGRIRAMAATDAEAQRIAGILRFPRKSEFVDLYNRHLAASLGGR